MRRATLLFVGAIATLCSASTSMLNDVRSTLPGAGQLRIASPSDLTHSDVIVKRVNDTLTLVCGDDSEETESNVVWYLPKDDRAYRGNWSEWEISDGMRERVSISGAVLQVSMLRLEDTGYYTCEVPPFTVSKYAVVQPPATQACARGGFSCGLHCVLPLYVCDGHADCPHGEDESEHACGKQRPCDGKLMCSDGRCISAAWCWEGSISIRARHSCCALYVQPSLEPEPPNLGDPLRPPPDYAHIQSTIYTVTACALIFMVAVVLLVSAICKMHMKRAALRSYARASRAGNIYPPCQLPPCYSTHQATLACPEDGSCSDGCDEPPAPATLSRPRSLAWLPQYRRVPQRDTPIERSLRRLTMPGHEYRVDSLEQRYGAARESDPRCDDSVTLRLGRFRVSVPRLARARGRRPDTPDVEMVHASELEVLRDPGDTYTLNGRTIRLLGADFQCPTVGGNMADPATFVGRVVAPPPYSAIVSAAPAKVLGPPPAYLSRENLTSDASAATDDNDNRVSVASTSSAVTDQYRDCNGNVPETIEVLEPPPSYDLAPEPIDNGNGE